MALSDDVFKTVNVRIRLDAQCSERIRARLGYPKENRTTVTPRLFEFSVDAFRTEQAESHWRGLQWLNRFEELVNVQVEPRNTSRVAKFGVSTSAITKAVDFFAAVLASVGVGAGWKLLGPDDHGGVSTWTEERLRQDQVSLSAFVRKTSPLLRVELSLFIADKAVRDATYGPMLPWILDLQARHQNKDDPEYQDATGHGSFPAFNTAQDKHTHSPACAPDQLADRWEQAHLVPRTVSPHAFKTIIAAIWRCFDHVRGDLSVPVHKVFEKADVLMADMPEFDDPQTIANALHSNFTLASNRNNNMLPLQPQLHDLFDKHEFYVCPFAGIPVWIGKGKMPAILVLALARGYRKLPLNTLRRCFDIAPAMLANACFVLSQLVATNDLKERLRARADKIIMRHKAGLPRPSKLGKHRRDDSDEDRGGDTKQPRTGRGSPPNAAPPGSAACAQSPDNEQQTSGPSDSGGNEEGPRTPSHAPEADALPLLSPSSAKRSDTSSGHSSWAGGVSSARSGACTQPTSVGNASEPPGRKQAGLAPTPRQNAPDKMGSPSAEARLPRVGRGRTLSDGDASDGSFFDSWWVKNGGAPGERHLRLAVVELKTFSCILESLQEYRRTPEEGFRHIRAVIKTSLGMAAGTWPPERGRHGQDHRRVEEAQDPEMQLVQEQASPRVLQIVGFNATGEDTGPAILNGTVFAELSICHERAGFFTWWPVQMAGETAGLDPSSLLVSESQCEGS